MKALSAELDQWIATLIPTALKGFRDGFRDSRLEHWHARLYPSRK